MAHVEGVRKQRDSRHTAKAAALAPSPWEAVASGVNGQDFGPFATAENPAGGRFWWGRDSVWNAGKLRGGGAHVAGGIMAACGIVFLPLALFGAAITGADDLGSQVAVTLALSMLGGGLWFYYNRAPEFLGGGWALASDGDTLNYKTEDRASGSADFSVSLDVIASVEAARTVEWQRSRIVEFLGGFRGASEIPEAEYQTFIMTRDGRRLVVMTANADREGTLALALSIKGWIEARRSAASPAARVEAGPVAEGLTL